MSHPAEPSQLRALRRRVARWAQEHRLPASTVNDLQLALGEAVSNGIEHAYPTTPVGTVEVDLEVRAAEDDPVVAVQVSDHGHWRPIPFVKGDRGRGLAMIDELSLDLRIATTERGTQVSFAVPIRY